MDDVLNRLIEIGQTGGGARCDSWLSSDLVDQDQLFEIQEKMTTLMADVSNQTKDGPTRLNKAFPWIFKVERAPATS